MSLKRIETIVAVLALFITISRGSPRPKRMYVMCPPKFERIGDDCYYISREKLTWLEAHFACKDKNSKLAEPGKYEDRSLRKYLIEKDPDRSLKWIGSVYNWEKNKWQWGQTGRDVIYQSFSQMDPRSSQDLRYHCSVLNPNLKYRWSAKNCVEKNAFVCQHRMQYVNEDNRFKIYKKWNATFPNEVANEVEVLLGDDLPRKNNYRRRKSQSNRPRIVSISDSHHIDTNQMPESGPERPSHHQKKNDKRRRNRMRPKSPPIVQETYQNDAAILQVVTSDIGFPIVESIPDNNHIETVATTTLPPATSRPPASRKPIKRRRKQRRRPTTPSPVTNEIPNEKKQFDDLDYLRKEKQRRPKISHEERERLIAERAMLEERNRQQEKERAREMERRRIEDAHRKVMEEKLAKEQHLLKEKEEYERRLAETEEAKETVRLEEERRIEERIRQDKFAKEEEEHKLEQQRIEKQIREEKRRQEEQRQRDEELREEEQLRQEEERKNEEREKQLEEKRRQEEEELAEAKRLETEQKAIAEAKQQEELAAEKAALEKRIKYEKLKERLKNLTPEQRKKFIEMTKQKRAMDKNGTS